MILELLTLDPLILAIGVSAIAGVLVFQIYIKNKNKTKKPQKTNASKSSVTDGAELVQPNDHEPQTYTINTVHDSTHYEHLDLNTQEINKPMRTILEETLRKKTTNSDLEQSEKISTTLNSEHQPHEESIEQELNSPQISEPVDYSAPSKNIQSFGGLLNYDPLLNDFDVPSSIRDIENQLLKLKEEAEHQDSLTEEETTKFFEAFQSLHEQNTTPTIEEENTIMSENQKSAVWANWMGTNNGKLSLKSSYFTLNSKWGTKSAIEELKTLINDQNQNDGATNPKNWVLLSIIEIKN